jgi:hypothetical protein
LAISVAASSESALMIEWPLALAPPSLTEPSFAMVLDAGG